MKVLWNILKIGLVVAALQGGALSAQMVQYGRVVVMNSGGKALQGVSVTIPAAHDCQPTASDVNGIFRLNFSEHSVGDVVVGLNARKHGFEMVNTHIAREGFTLTNRDTLRVVMAPEGKLKEAQMRYYFLLEEACVSRYDSTMSFLNEQFAQQIITRPELNYWKSQAEAELKEAYLQIEGCADRLARLNEDDLDEETRSAYQRMQTGDTEAAFALSGDAPATSVIDNYMIFSGAYPMTIPEEYTASDMYALLNVPESLRSDVITLDNYCLQYESDFATNGAKYAQSCTYLGRIFMDIDDDIMAAFCFRKALRTYELLEEIEVGDFRQQRAELQDLLKRVE